MSKVIKDFYLKVPADNIQHPKYFADEWVTCTDIKEELKKNGHCVTLQKIGRYAREYGLSKETKLGFKLYHRQLVKIIMEDLQ